MDSWCFLPERSRLDDWFLGQPPPVHSSRRCMRRWLGLGRHLYLPETGLVNIYLKGVNVLFKMYIFIHKCTKYIKQRISFVWEKFSDWNVVFPPPLFHKTLNIKSWVTMIYFSKFWHVVWYFWVSVMWKYMKRLCFFLFYKSLCLIRLALTEIYEMCI